jgi:hypothetical protein
MPSCQHTTAQLFLLVLGTSKRGRINCGCLGLLHIPYIGQSHSPALHFALIILRRSPVNAFALIHFFFVERQREQRE